MAKAKNEASSQEGLADDVATRVQDASSAAEETASELREQGTARLRDQFDQRSTHAATQMRSLAKALRRSGDELTNEGNGGTAQQLTGQAADRIERLGGYLEQKSGDEVMRDIEGFARRRPWLLAGLGALVGAAAARFMKASSEQRYGDYRRASSQWANGAQLPASSAAGTAGRPEREPEDESEARSDDRLARAGAR